MIDGAQQASPARSALSEHPEVSEKVEVMRWRYGPPMSEEQLERLGTWVCEVYGAEEAQLSATGDGEWLAFYLPATLIHLR